MSYIDARDMTYQVLSHYGYIPEPEEPQDVLSHMEDSVSDPR